MIERTFRLAELHTISDDIEGRVKFSKHFERLHRVAKMDLLVDWINELQSEYEFIVDNPDSAIRETSDEG